MSEAEAARGLRIIGVVRGSGAAQAGLRPGDIILRADGRGVSDPRRFVQQIRGMGQGDDLGLTVLRDGTETEMNASVGASDRQEVAKPALDEARSAESLREEIRRLEQELQQLESQADGQSGAAGNTDRATTPDGSKDSSGIQSEQRLDAPNDGESNDRRSSKAKDGSDLSEAGETRSDVAAEAKSETEAGVQSAATESAPRPGEPARQPDGQSDGATDRAPDSPANAPSDAASDSSDKGDNGSSSDDDSSPDSDNR